MLEALTEYLNTCREKNPKSVILIGRAKNHPGLEHINIFSLNIVIYVQIYKEIGSDNLSRLVELLSRHFPGFHFSIVDRSANPPRMLFLSPEITEDIIYRENGLSFYLDLNRPSHPGLFFDIEPARRWVLENSQGKKVLNLFAFTCAFSVCAVAGGAEAVVNIDNNSNILARGRRNHQLNNQDLSKVKFEKKDIIKNFGFIDRKGPYDLIICDPPSAQGKSFNAERNYSKMISRLKCSLKKNGIIMLCLNSPFLGFDFLEMIIQEQELEEILRIDPSEEFVPDDRDSGLKIICTKIKHPE